MGVIAEEAITPIGNINAGGDTGYAENSVYPSKLKK